MLMRLRTLALLCSLVILFTGCRASQIKSELAKLDAQRTASQERIDGVDRNIAALRREQNEIASRATARRSEVAAYMKEHVLAIVCMASVGYSLGKDNLFSDEANKMINLGTVMCIAGVLLSDDFSNEVASVVQELESASAEIKQLEAQVSAIRPKLNSALTTRTAEQTELKAITDKIETLQAELRTYE